jgi:hypothetical protein
MPVKWRKIMPTGKIIELESAPCLKISRDRVLGPKTFRLKPPLGVFFLRHHASPRAKTGADPVGGSCCFLSSAVFLTSPVVKGFLILLGSLSFEVSLAPTVPERPCARYITIAEGALAVWVVIVTIFLGGLVIALFAAAPCGMLTFGFLRRRSWCILIVDDWKLPSILFAVYLLSLLLLSSVQTILAVFLLAGATHISSFFRLPRSRMLFASDRGMRTWMLHRS